MTNGIEISCGFDAIFFTYFLEQFLNSSQIYVILYLIDWLVNEKEVAYMRATEEQHNARKREMMEKCFECYAENGLTGTGIKALAAACGCTTGNLYSYFSSVDELIIESTAYCMEKVEDDFMEMAPTDPKDVVRFVKEVPVLDGKKARQEVSADVSDLYAPEIYRARQEVF